MNEPINLDHLQQTHPDLWRGLHALLSFEGDVESTFMADFTVPSEAFSRLLAASHALSRLLSPPQVTSEAFGAMHITELVPNGANTPVTNANRAEYTRRYAEWMLDASVATQFAAFQKGFLLLCDGPALSLLTPKELESLVVGVPHLDFHALQANTVYDAGFHAEHPYRRTGARALWPFARRLWKTRLKGFHFDLKCKDPIQP